jgi:hypothetical protein
LAIALAKLMLAKEENFSSLQRQVLYLLGVLGVLGG